MAILFASSTRISIFLHPNSGKWKISSVNAVKHHSNSCYSLYIGNRSKKKTRSLRYICCMKMGESESKLVWIWTKNKQVMTTAVERGWDIFIFDTDSAELAKDWSWSTYRFGKQKCSVILRDIISAINRPDASYGSDGILHHLVTRCQMIPAENIVAAFQGDKKRVFAVAETASEAQTFLEALEHGLGGIVLKVDDIDPVLKLKEYFDRRSEERNKLILTKATVNQVCTAGMGDRVCVDLCSLLRPGEGLLVGSFARGLFLVHSECLENDYIASRPFRVNAGPVHAYVAVPDGKTCYLSELKAGKEVIVVDRNGQQRTAIVGRVKIETRPLVLIEAKVHKRLQFR